ncbi:SCO family protein [Bacillus sp. V3B]|nr:SCO family protein [Bacillus sp. V3B]
MVMILFLSACGVNEIKNPDNLQVTDFTHADQKEEASGVNGIKNPHNWQVPDFTHTDQNGEPFGLRDLEGKVWVANFIFTNCEDVCLPMTANMKTLQDEVKKAGIENIQFVSFSVDPAVDTPEVLTDFAEKFSVDFSNWHFLTGYTPEYIADFAMEVFTTVAIKPEAGDQVLHGTSFYLIDKEGKVMKDYTGLVDIPMDELIEDIKSLQ